MRFNRIKLSFRSQNLLGTMKKRTGLTPNLLARFSLCLSLKDPSIPNPDEFDDKGSEISPQVLFGEYEDTYRALMIQRLNTDHLLLNQDMLNKMLKAHLNRGTIALFARIHDLSDFHEMIKVERAQ